MLEKIHSNSLPNPGCITEESDELNTDDSSSTLDGNNNSDEHDEPNASDHHISCAPPVSPKLTVT